MAKMSNKAKRKRRRSSPVLRKRLTISMKNFLHVKETIRKVGGNMNFFMKLIRNNTGVSSKNFFLVMVTLVGILLLLIVAFVLIWEVIQNGTIQTDMQGLAMFVGSITSLFTAACSSRERSFHWVPDRARKLDSNFYQQSLPLQIYHHQYRANNEFFQIYFL